MMLWPLNQNVAGVMWTWLLLLLQCCTDLAAAQTTVSMVSTRDVDANGLTFACDWLDTSATSGVHPVILLHGFAGGKAWWKPLLDSWAKEGLPLLVLACDLRGYSPQATPTDIAAYRYENMVDDVYALATAVNFTTHFHVVGHDQGAVLGWIVAAQNRDNRVLSYSAMSVPHVDLLSSALCGPDNTFDAEQVLASNHFNQWALPDSATINNNALTTMLYNDYKVALAASPNTIQPPLWWYNGSMPHYIALPRVVGQYEVTADQALLSRTRAAIPLPERPCVPQQSPTGSVNVSVLFICGAQDPYLLCQHSYATPSASLIPDYTTATVESCGHDFFLPTDCTEDDDNGRTIRTLTDFVFSRGGSGLEIPAKPSGWGPPPSTSNSSVVTANNGNTTAGATAAVDNAGGTTTTTTTSGGGATTGVGAAWRVVVGVVMMVIPFTG